MMERVMNPYASFLGTRDPVEVISSTVGEIENIAARIGSANMSRKPAPDKWSAREILCHLADCEVVFAFRLRQAVAEDGHVIQPFDQEKWAKQYDAFGAPEALAVFESVRGWNITFIRSLPKEAFDRTLTHPERGDMTLRTVVETMGGHDRNHLIQLEVLSALQSVAAQGT